MAKLTATDLAKIIHRSFYIQGSWNYERMLGLGFCSCSIPFVRRVLKEPAKIRDFLKRNLAFFNTHPYMAGWIIGATLKQEELALSRRGADFQQIDRFKKHLSQFMAAIGDRFFWGLLKPVTALAGFVIALFFQWIGAVFFLIAYNVPHLYIRIKGVVNGYREGQQIMDTFSIRKFNEASARLLQLGALTTGFAVVVTLGEISGNWLNYAIFFISSLAAHLYTGKGVDTPAVLLLIVVLGIVAGGLLL